jgi:hypothetical protein
MTNKEILKNELLKATGFYKEIGKKGGNTNKLSGHMSKVGKKNGAKNGKSENSKREASKTGKIWGKINIKKITKEQKSVGGKIGGKVRASQSDFHQHLSNMGKKSAKIQIEKKLIKFKSILSLIRKKEFTAKDIQKACLKMNYKSWQSVLKEKSLIKQTYKGCNQFDPSIYVKVK